MYMYIVLVFACSRLPTSGDLVYVFGHAIFKIGPVDSEHGSATCALEVADDIISNLFIEFESKVGRAILDALGAVLIKVAALLSRKRIIRTRAASIGVHPAFLTH